MPSAKILEKKKVECAELTEKIQNAVAGVLVSYTGITVEQACTLLYRFLLFTRADNDKITQLTLDEYSDCDGVAAWAKESVAWAVENGVYLGTLGKTSKLNPNDAASRAVFAEMLYMYDAIYN